MHRRVPLALIALALVPIEPACGGEASPSPTMDANDTDDDDDGKSEPELVVSKSLMKLPIGDGKHKATAERGYVFSCQQNFRGGPGAQVDGPWIDKEKNTFDFTAKVVVKGSVDWPHTFSANVSGTKRMVKSNGLPDHETGTYPIASNDPAFEFDRNPNKISEQERNWALPAKPAVADAASCLGLGPIGILLTGAVFFNALDAEGRDAVAHETQDSCQAHPEMSGEYHYHSVTQCISDKGKGHSALLGYARDGFGIYGVRGEDGKTLTNADLDECHGHTHAITWDGAKISLYHYHATYEYPYTLGCFKGAPIKI